MVPAALAIIFALVVSLILKKIFWKGKQLPPGPNGLPVIGYLHKICSAPLHVIMNDLSRTYGNTFCVQLGSRLTLVLNSRAVIYEAFVKKAKSFAGRPDLATFNKTRHGCIGISMCDFSEAYRLNRKMTVKALHRLFSDKEKLNFIMEQEVHKMVNLFDQFAHFKKPFNPGEAFYKIVPSLIVNLTFGRNFDYDDQDLIALVNFNRRWFESAEANNPADFFKILEMFPNKRLTAIKESAAAFYSYILNKIDEHETNNWGLLQTYLEYYRDMLGVTELSNSEKLELARVIADILGGGFDTVAITLSWALLFLDDQPEVTIKCRNEIQRVCPDEILRIEHQSDCPYFCATINEILRNASTAPMGLPRTTTEDVHTSEYFIPKGTMVLPNIWAVNRDSTLWKGPGIINPDNFLDADGAIDKNAVRKLATFSSGLRKCPGDKLAFSEMFVLLGTFIKSFEFTIDQHPPDMQPLPGLTSQPKSYTIQISKIATNNNI